jgi:hypothetical protein
MLKLNKNQGIWGLFILIAIILFVSPNIIRNMYNNILGRIIFLVIIIFLTMNNITLGLLTALILIIASNMYSIEGLENADVTKEDIAANRDGERVDGERVDGERVDGEGPNGDLANKIQVLTKSAKEKLEGAVSDVSKISEIKDNIKAKADENGVDRNTIKDSLAAKSSNEIPVSTSSSSESVEPTDPTTSAFSGMSATV